MVVKKVMWTNVSIDIYDDNFDKNIYDKAFNIFYKNEEKFSRFNENSLLSKLNKEKEYKVDNDFIKVLELSKFFYKKTNWYFNPLVNLSNIWYSESFDKKKFQKKKVKLI
jgi:thiamine biosynthesis lipoprotein ApbE